jgi:hypothetical protein
MNPPDQLPLDEALAKLLEDLAQALDYWTIAESDQLTQAGKNWTQDQRIVQHRTLIMHAMATAKALLHGNWTTENN